MSDILEGACLELLPSGWQLSGPNMLTPVPLTVARAYAASGHGQDILDETRRLCGILRFSKEPSHKEHLKRLREELAEARKLKEDHSE